MATYYETSTCMVCGAKVRTEVESYGDYDGPSIPIEADPDTCSGCSAIRERSPEHYALLRLLLDRLKRERLAHEKRVMELKSSSFSVDQLFRPFMSLYAGEKLASIYKEQLDFYADCAKGSEPDSEWILESSAKKFAFRILEIATGKSQQL